MMVRDTQSLTHLLARGEADCYPDKMGTKDNCTIYVFLGGTMQDMSILYCSTLLDVLLHWRVQVYLEVAK